MNPRPSAWEADALPLSYSRLLRDVDFSNSVGIEQGGRRVQARSGPARGPIGGRPLNGEEGPKAACGFRFSPNSVSFWFILSCLLAGSAGCVQHLETLARRNWAGKLQSVTEMRHVGRGPNRVVRGRQLAGSVPCGGESSTDVRRDQEGLGESWPDEFRGRDREGRSSSENLGRRRYCAGGGNLAGAGHERDASPAYPCSQHSSATGDC